jgi:peptidoglycan/LPS O-acetylase OafA/YrhL
MVPQQSLYNNQPTSTIESTEKKFRQIVRGLDTIRCLCAFWVVMGHCGVPPMLKGLDESSRIGFIIQAIYANLWTGPSAVIVFFVISGFCIHYPQANQSKIANLPVYFLRRYLRIGIPLIAATLISPFVKMYMPLFSDSILWSLAAELIYYSIYPIILNIRQKFRISWTQIIFVSFIAALLVASTNAGADGYPVFGLGLNWLLGLPCWLLGVQLAEKVASDNEPKPQNIWFWRMGVWGASTVLSVLRFHSPIGYPWTLNFFAILVSFWLLQEIRLYKHETPPKLLEWIGTWSYSIYLIHTLAQQLWNMMPHDNLGYFLNWLTNMTFLLACSYAFAVLVEFPSHRLTKSLGRRLTAWQKTTAT